MNKVYKQSLRLGRGLLGFAALTASICRGQEVGSLRIAIAGKQLQVDYQLPESKISWNAVPGTVVNTTYTVSGTVPVTSTPLPGFVGFLTRQGLTLDTGVRYQKLEMQDSLLRAEDSTILPVVADTFTFLGSGQWEEKWAYLLDPSNSVTRPISSLAAIFGNDSRIGDAMTFAVPAAETTIVHYVWNSGSGYGYFPDDDPAGGEPYYIYNIIDLTLSAPVGPVTTGGGPVTYSYSIDGTPAVSRSGTDSVSAVYRLTVPEGSAGTIRWFEVFTSMANPGNKQYTAREWEVSGTTSPDFTLAAPADGSSTLVPYDAQLAVDANRDGTIKLASEDASDVTSVDHPYRFWLNDDDDAAVLAGHTSFREDWSTPQVDGGKDLEDFFPVFLDIQGLVKALPPSGPDIVYKLKQADGALNFVYTNLTREQAFSFRLGPPLTTGFGNVFLSRPGAAETSQITAEGVQLSSQFLNNIKDNNQGVILVEGRRDTTQPLVLTAEKDGVILAEVRLPLSIGARVLLLLHGMNSYSKTWDDFVNATFAGSSFRSSFCDILGSGFEVAAPTPNSNGVRCYRLQFGRETLATAREGLNHLKAVDAFGTEENSAVPYLNPVVRCGDFETFSELAEQIREAVALLQIRHPNCQIVLLGHSRGGMMGRNFLQGNSVEKSAVVGLLTSSSPHKGSRVGRMYQWLNEHDSSVNPGEIDWGVAGGLRPYIDIRRPIIMDISDHDFAGGLYSAAIKALNSSAAVENLPATVTYGEIVHKRADLGLVKEVGLDYSIFTGLGGVIGPYFIVSLPAKTFMLDEGNTPGSFPGDGLVPATDQIFTGLPGFSTQNHVIDRLIVKDHNVLHTDAPKQTWELNTQLKKLAPSWFE